MTGARSGSRMARLAPSGFFNRPGPRVVESAEILAELLHPEVFDFGHRGSGWTEWVGF